MRQKGFKDIIILASIMIVSLSIYFIFKSNQKVNTPNFGLTPTFSPDCAKVGQKPIGNFDLRTGKIDNSITVINCCEGLKGINKKQVGEIKRSKSGDVVCKMEVGVSNSICSPCGNGKCDTDYEDVCNCLEDCKEHAKF